MPRFDRNKRYVNRKGQRFGKGVWYDDNGKILQPGFGRFEDSSRIDRTVTQYNTDGTISTFSWEDWVKKNGIDHELRVLQNDRKYAIPFIPDKKVTISIDKNSPTRKNDGAVFSENLLDSIAINAKKAGLSFGDALGIVAQESTFGNGNHRGTGQTLLPWLPVLNQSSGEQKDKAEKMPYQGFQSPSLLISNWKQREENPYAEFFYDGKGNVLHTSKSKEYYDEYFRPHLVKGNRYHLQEESPLQHGFRNYKEHPKSWNYGDSDYQNKITIQKKELTQYSPEIREYMRKHGLHAYGGPLVEQANMFEIGGPKKKLSDKEYYSIMEKVAENNNPIWNSQRIKNGGRPLSVDEEYLRILNDNTYDYRGFYDNNPIDAADASTHWPDSYKTVYHPTFSTYSDYSGKVSDFNPLGLEGGTWPKGPTEAREEDFIPAWWQSIPNAYTGRQHDEGGSLNAYKSWDNLSIKEKSEMMKVAIRNGITNLADIKAKYNEFAEGGYMTSEEDNDVNMYDGISQRSQQMQQRYIYDILPRLYAMDGVNVVLSSGLRPNAVVYQNGKPTGRKSRHGSGQAADIVPVKGSTFADIFRVLHNPNSNVSRWMRANNAGYIDETSATGTTKYWHDHNRDHSHVHHQIGGNPASQYAARFGNSVSSVGNYRDIAKQHIRQNEGWSATPYADGPNGWRSVGYGFNDSGFRTKYPGGIANYYAQRGGITKAEAERELDWFLNNMEASLRKTYGRRWDSFSDNQKAAIMDTAYQRPASVDAKSAFYAAVMSGNPNAGNLLGVKGFDKRNADRRNLFSSSAVQAMNPQNYGQQQPQMAYNPFEGWEPMNPQAFYGNPEQMGVIEQLAQQNAQMQAAFEKQEAEKLLAAQQQAKAEERALQRNRTNLALQMVGMMGSDDGSSEFDMLRPLLGNISAYGGHLYDGETEPTQQMKKRKNYETIFTGDIDSLTFKDNNPWDAYLGNEKLDVEDTGIDYTYRSKNGKNVWRVPKSQWKDANPYQNKYEQFLPTGYSKEDVDKLVETLGYNPESTESLSMTRKEPELQEVCPEFAALTMGRGWGNGALKNTWNALNTAGDAAAETSFGRSATSLLTNPYFDAGLTSYFGTHGLNDVANGNANAWTVLEMMPLMRLPKAVGQGFRGLINEAGNYVYPSFGEMKVPEGLFEYKPTSKVKMSRKVQESPLLSLKSATLHPGCRFAV